MARQISKNAPSTLVSRPLEAAFAHLTQSLPCLDGKIGDVSVADFLSHVAHLSRHLPEQPYVLNLCENRYLFTVAFCAALLRGQTNLLPPNKADNTLATLGHHYACYCLVDNPLESQPDALDIRQLALTGPSTQAASEQVICPEHVAAICFTSGSTGDSKPIVKTWGLLQAANRLNARFMLGDLQLPHYQIATVPGQHMWGLETTVLLPLVANVVLSDAKPFYPADVASLAAQLPEPRLIVSTPIHLRALVKSNIDLPTIERILCATAPLPQPLAQQVEDNCKGVIAEVYGCSEMGSMAVRRPSQTDVWRLFDAFTLTPEANGQCLARATHIAEDVVLGDFVEQQDERHFLLGSRTDDTVNIGGKRGSLAEINAVLLRCPGVDDGVVFQSDKHRESGRLAALVVLAPQFTSAQLADYFRQHIDAAFVPRPIIAVAALPRSENGKITRKAVLECYRQQLSSE